MKYVNLMELCHLASGVYHFWCFQFGCPSIEDRRGLIIEQPCGTKLRWGLIGVGAVDNMKVIGFPCSVQ